MVACAGDGLAGQWAGAALRLLVDEVIRGATLTGEWGHALFARWLRVARAEASGASPPGDGRVLRALSLMHARLDSPWTIERLARATALSRSAFAERFRKDVGVPVVEYLRRARMDMAERLIGRRTLSMKEIAARLGYESASAFGKAFRRSFGASPPEYRARLAAPGGTWLTPLAPASARPRP